MHTTEGHCINDKNISITFQMRHVLIEDNRIKSPHESKRSFLIYVKKVAKNYRYYYPLVIIASAYASNYTDEYKYEGNEYSMIFRLHCGYVCVYVTE